MNTPVLRVYSRDGCHLCEQALRELAPLAAELGAAIDVVDIESDRALHARYLERIPVIALDGEELYDFFVDVADLRLRLRSCIRAGRVSWRMSIGEIAASAAVEGDGEAPAERLSLGVAARLSRYLQVLTQAKKMGKETISSQELSDYTHVNSTQIRRDLSGFGKFGKRGVGYNVDSLVGQIRRILQTAGQHNIALFGAGHLGNAIASSDIFADHGFNVVAIFDSDARKIGAKVGGQSVRDIAELGQVVEEEDIVVGVLAVPTVGRPAARRRARRGRREDHLQLLRGPARRCRPRSRSTPRSPAVDLLYALYFYLT